MFYSKIIFSSHGLNLLQQSERWDYVDVADDEYDQNDGDLFVRGVSDERNITKDMLHIVYRERKGPYDKNSVADVVV